MIGQDSIWFVWGLGIGLGFMIRARV